MLQQKDCSKLIFPFVSIYIDTFLTWILPLKVFCLIVFSLALSKAQALVNEGLMEALVDLKRVEEYWRQMLADFPSHPAASDPGQSLPITLYGTSPRNN